MSMLSVTALSGYLYCPRKIYLAYTLGIREPKSRALIMGSIRHNVFEKMNNVEEAIVKAITGPLDEEDIVSRYKERYLNILRQGIACNEKSLGGFGITCQEAFDKMHDSVLKEAEKRAKNVALFIKTSQIYGENLWEKLTPKIISEFRIESARLGVKGIIDQVEMHDQFMIPIELKTGKAPEEGAWPSHKLQLTAYMALLEGKQRAVKKGRIVYLDENKTIEIQNNPFIEEEISRMVRKTCETLSSRKPPEFSDNKNKCRACGIKDSCYDLNLVQSRINQVFRS